MSFVIEIVYVLDTAGFSSDPRLKKMMSHRAAGQNEIHLLQVSINAR